MHTLEDSETSVILDLVTSKSDCFFALSRVGEIINIESVSYLIVRHMYYYSLQLLKTLDGRGRI